MTKCHRGFDSYCIDAPRCRISFSAEEEAARLNLLIRFHGLQILQVEFWFFRLDPNSVTPSYSLCPFVTQNAYAETAIQVAHAA
ncbi:hypothetical protein EMIT0P253_30080 [Pseudomonas sp. IT-P253]